MPTTTAPSGVSCPTCGAANMWDNRTTKKNPKAPDYKCRDKNCEGVIWPPKPGQRSPVSAAPATEKQAFTAGPHIEAMDGPKQETTTLTQNGAPNDAAPVIARLNSMFSLYDVCQDHVLAVSVPKLVKAGIGASDTSVAAMTATLYIQASQRGIAA